MKGWRSFLFLAALGPALPIVAEPPESLRYSADVTVGLGALVPDDEALTEDDRAGTLTAVNLGVLPVNADLDAYHLLADGDHLLSFDTAVVLPGDVTAGPGDIVRFDGVAYVLELTAADHSLPPGLDADAVSAIDGIDLVVSFDTSFDLAGQAINDEDLVRRTGTVLSLVFDGSTEGVAPELAIDAVHHVDADGHQLLSFDGSGTVGGVDFDDEDILEYDPQGGIWSLVYDGSAEHAGWQAADLDALYATFPPTDATLTMTLAGTGAGTVTSTPAGIDCGDTCAFAFTLGTPVTLAAQVGSMSLFSGWSGDTDCADGAVTLDVDVDCIVTFDVDPVYVIFIDGFESGTPNNWSSVVGNR